MFLADERCIRFLGSVTPWLYKTTRALSAQDVLQVQHGEQYGARWAPQTVPWQMRQRKDQPGLELRLSDSGKDYLAFEEPLPDLGWTLTLTADSKVVTQARQRAWVLATLA